MEGSKFMEEQLLLPWDGVSTSVGHDWEVRQYSQ